MLLTGCRLNSCDNLPCYAKLSKCPEGGQLVIAEIPDRLVKTNHTFLDNILTVSTNQKVCTGLRTHEGTVFIYEIIKGLVITICLDFENDILVCQLIKSFVDFFTKQNITFHPAAPSFLYVCR